MLAKNWFEVSRQGLKELQAGKPKHYVARELIQNAWDENITVCKMASSYSNGIAHLIVVDDSPEGFRNIADAYTLFAPTVKRFKAEKLLPCASGFFFGSTNYDKWYVQDLVHTKKALEEILLDGGSEDFVYRASW
jgi:hypothetical protein